MSDMAVRMKDNRAGPRRVRRDRLESPQEPRGHRRGKPGSACSKRMKELDYQPNLAARALVTGRTLTIGLVVPDLVHPFFSEVPRAFPARCASRATAC